MMVMMDVEVIWCVAATTASNLDITIMRRTIAVNSLTSTHLSQLNLPNLQRHLHQIKDARVVTMDRDDAAVLKTPVMKERETVMVH